MDGSCPPTVDYERLKNQHTNHNGITLSEKLKGTFISQPRLKFNTLYGFVMVSPAEIIYCQAEGTYCKIFMSNGKQELLSIHLKLLEKNHLPRLSSVSTGQQP